MRAVIYARYSTDHQREASIEDQIRGCERVAVSNGLTIVARFEDRCISGGTQQREGYQALLTAARAGHFEIILAEDISRLWRGRAEFGTRSAELEDLGIHLLTSVGEDTRRDGYGLMISIKAAIAEHARKEISFRTKRGLEGLALAGKSTGGRTYGDGGPQEVDVVRGIYQSRAGGASLGAIAGSLTAAGIPTPRGGSDWGRSTVASILRNRRYLGEVRWGVTEGKGGAADSRRRRWVARAEPLVSRFDPSVQIIDQTLFDAAQAA
jgi:site-specific DNA recombinase